MGGVDFSGEPSEISPHSFAYLENMYRDYEVASGAGVETVPGFRRVRELPGRIHAIHPDPRERGSFLIHAKDALYRFRTEERDASDVLTPLGGGARPADRTSHSSLFAGRLCLLDGEHFTVTDGGSLVEAADEAYVPTLFSDGEECEQRNLFTDRGIEEHHLYDTGAYAYTSEGIRYTVNDQGVCLVAGVEATEETVTIPARVLLGQRLYAVAGLADFALMGTDGIKTLILSEGITLLGNGCFFGMQSLETVVLPSTVTVISVQAFDSCTALKTLYLPRETVEVRERAFYGVALSTVYYAGTLAEYTMIGGNENIFPLHNPHSCVLRPETAYRGVRLFFPFLSPAEELCSVTLNGKEIPIRSTGADGSTESNGGAGYRLTPLDATEGRPMGLLLEAESFEGLYGATLTLTLRLENDFPEVMAAEGRSYTGSGRAALNACRLVARYDGRLFLSGNPDLPGMVFYSQRDRKGRSLPGYFGIYNRLTDGDGRTPVRALLATPGYLLVLTDVPPDGHSVFCHVGEDTEDDLVPRIYPTTEGVSSLGCLGEATLFRDEAVFLSASGLECIQEAKLSGEHSTRHLSSAVDTRLVAEPLEEARLFRYRDYLGIAVRGRVYLADGRRRVSRDGHAEYDWYYLSDLGVYRGQTDRYRYTTARPEGLPEGASVMQNGKPLPIVTAEAEGYADGCTVFSATSSEGVAFRYTVKDGRATLVDTDGEQIGGIFSPATVFFESEGLLFFGTQAGDLCVFNTDKREADGLIPRRFYTFNGRAYLSGCATKSDNCDLPHLTKSTVRTGGAVKLKTMTGGRIEVRVRTDSEGWSVADTLYGGRLDYSETDFASAEFLTTPDTVVRLRESKKRWVEKQLYFVSEEYQRPFGIITIAYQYRVAGRIKR